LGKFEELTGRGTLSKKGPWGKVKKFKTPLFWRKLGFKKLVPFGLKKPPKKPPFLRNPFFGKES